MRRVLQVSVLVLALLPLVGMAAEDIYEFETEEQEARFERLSREFRCPMCQNANLADSPGGVAADLRREIHRMIMEGRSDEEIEQFMQERYGDFIFYRPPFNFQTLLLWLGPLLFLGIGGWIAYKLMRPDPAGAAQEEALDEEERRRLRELMGGGPRDSGSADDGSGPPPRD